MAFLGDIEASSIILRDVSDPAHPTDGPVQISLFTGALGGAVGIGGHGLDGTISMSDSNGNTNIVLDAAACNINIGGGGPGADGTISIADGNGQANVVLDAASCAINVSGKGAISPNSGSASCSVNIGGNGGDGTINLVNSLGDTQIVLESSSGVINVGGKGTDGAINIFDTDGLTSISVNAKLGKIYLTHDPSLSKLGIELFGNLGLIVAHRHSVGGPGASGRIDLFDDAGKERISLDAQGGTILADGGFVVTNADCAEDFDMAAPGVEPGTVMVIDSEGALRPSLGAYDKRVAGVLSGAGGFKPGITLDKQPRPGAERLPVALLGKVYCKVDAEHAPIEVGDLLTTSMTPGHAMRADDPMQAFGSVLGKALRPWKEGKGMIPILVALQ